MTASELHSADDFINDLVFVHGYDDDAEPRSTRPAGRDDERFAVVMDTYKPGNPDAIFSYSVYKYVVLAALEVLGYKEVVFSWDDGSMARCVAAVHEKMESLSPSDREPPRLVEVFQNDARVAVLETEDWVRFGGPYPYHDSYTFVLYGERSLVDRFSLECHELARAYEIAYTDIYGRRRR